jgi:hypothetical protein
LVLHHVGSRAQQKMRARGEALLMSIPIEVKKSVILAGKQHVT